MIYKEEQRDLFSVSSDYYLAHCISADFKMGAGIAKKFTETGTKAELTAMYPKSWNGNGYCLRSCGVPVTNGKCVAVYNLITKERYWHKPTYDTLRQSLESLRDNYSASKIAMPKIGCGLDRLDWDKVKPIIQEVFADTDIEILVCYL